MESRGHRGPALSDRDARDEEHHSLAFLNEARGRKNTAGDGVARRRQGVAERQLLVVAKAASAQQPTREPDARRRQTRRGEARITLPENSDAAAPRHGPQMMKCSRVRS